MKETFTRDQVLAIINDMLQRGDALIEAVSDENTDLCAEDFLEWAEDDLDLDNPPHFTHNLTA